MGSDRIGFTVSAILCLVALSLAAGGAAGLEMTPELRKVVAGAKAEGKLKLQSPSGLLGGRAGVTEAMAWIKKEFGLVLEPSWNPNSSFRGLMSKIYMESQANQSASSDAFIGTATQIPGMLETGIYRTVPWTRLMPGRITAKLVEGDGRALRVVTRFPGILYNKQRVPEMAQVRSMYDLLKPEFKGKFAINSELAGAAGLISRWGLPKTRDYVTQLKPQVSGFVPCGSGERIASGEVLALALDCAGTEHLQARFRNVLAFQIPHDAALRIYNYITIPTNAVNPNAAILFALWISSPEGQAWNRARDGTELDMYPESESGKMVAALEKQGVEFLDFTLEWGKTNSNAPAQVGELMKLLR